MNKESILFNHLGVFSYRLETNTLKLEEGGVCTYYKVIWLTRYGKPATFEQSITKEEYEILLGEMECK